ncbi:hypothetical protein F4809DRAFT_216543 [Biscogniauxia mediterranea]|nr:hypothetical protein F4809DRAFT_216543 [Biscogniauxia mediterranea]
MASGLFFDPMVALRAAPLVSSTCTLLYAWDQHLFLSLLNARQVREHSRPMIPIYFKKLFYRALPMVLGFLTVTTSTAVANLYTQRATLQARGSLWWYTAGAALAVSHLGFVPFIAPSVKGMIEASSEDDANKSLDEWLSVNMIRSLTVDLGAWIAVTVAVVKTLRV